MIVYTAKCNIFRNAIQLPSESSDLLPVISFGLSLGVTYIHTSFQVLPAGLFSNLFTYECKVRWLRVLARPLQAVHNGFLATLIDKCVGSFKSPYRTSRDWTNGLTSMSTEFGRFCLYFLAFS